MPMTHIQIIRMAIIIRLPTRPLLRWIQRIIVVGDRAGNTSFGEFTLESFFPNLSALPRNTHVVVRITINDANDISWQVDLRPYGEVVLEPEFGI